MGRNVVELKDYLRVLRQGWRWIALAVLVGTGAAALVTISTPASYQSDVKFFVRAANPDGSIANAYTGSLFTQQRVKSYKEFVTSPTITQVVIDRLGLTDLSAAQVGKKISADANLDTVNLNLHVRDADPVRAQEIAQTAAEVFVAYIGELEGSAGTISPVKLEIVLPAALGSQVAPRPTLNLALGLLVGLALGVGLAVLRETLDTRVNSPADLAALFKVPTLAVVGLDPLAKTQPLIVRDDHRSPRAEAFRRLRTNLQFVDVDNSPRSIVVTSALEAEGKTTTACNLAITLAAAGADVILVDGDLRRPSVHKYLGIEGAVGLTNVLIGQVSLDNALQSWGDSGRMHVLPAGVLPPNPSELLASQHLQDLLAGLERRAMVIIDAPPLLPVTDAAILGAQASGALMVIRQGKTRKEQVAQAIEALNSVGAHLFGSVLNMARTRGADAENYGYGYYGKYASELPEFVPQAAARPQPSTLAPERSAEQADTRARWPFAPDAEPTS
jgi:capsular exopolysaccharide synthesis family protein